MKMELLSLLNELKQMKWIDLSHEFGENTPRWPGFESLRKEIKLIREQSVSGQRKKQLTIY